MKNLIKNLAILFAVLVLIYFSASQLGRFYEYIFPKSIGGGGIFAITHDAGLQLRGLSLAYTFFLALLFTLFGGSKKYWWIGVLLIPAAIFEVYFDLSHIYFPIILGLAGWLLGFLARKIFAR